MRIARLVPLSLVTCLVVLSTLVSCQRRPSEALPKDSQVSVKTDPRTPIFAASSKPAAERTLGVVSPSPPVVEPEHQDAEPRISYQDRDLEPAADKPLPETPDSQTSPEALMVRRTVPLTLGAGTEFEVELLQAISTNEAVVGDPVQARVVHDLAVDGIVAIPAGSSIVGSVIEVDTGRKIGGQAHLVLGFQRLQPPRSDPVPIRATWVGTGKDQRKKDAATIGGGVAGGAVLGRVLSKKNTSMKSVLGAILGAAIGTAVASKTPAEAVELEPGTVLRLRLEEWARVHLERPPNLRVDPPPGQDWQ